MKSFSYLNVNRDVIDPTTHLWTQGPNLNGSSDKTVAVIRFETPEGQPIAAYIDYAMHPVNGYLAGFTNRHGDARQWHGELRLYPRRRVVRSLYVPGIELAFKAGKRRKRHRRWTHGFNSAEQ
jgi:hypothetical protein